MNKCKNCNKDVRRFETHCNFDCVVESAKKDGGIQYTPNNLPIKCVTGRNEMLEHADASHISYLFPVDIIYTGDSSIFDMENEDGSSSPCDEVSLAIQTNETHALIYTDGAVALTIYECQYYLWNIVDGMILHHPSSFFSNGKPSWKIKEESLNKIKEYSKNIYDKFEAIREKTVSIALKMRQCNVDYNLITFCVNESNNNGGYLDLLELWDKASSDTEREAIILVLKQQKKDHESNILAKTLEIKEDNLDKKCTACAKGFFTETTQYDDYDGTLHCNKCNYKIDRYTKEWT